MGLRLERAVSAVRLFSQAIIFKKRKCQLRNRTSPKMIPRQWIMPTTTLAGRDPAPPTKSQRPKGVPSPVPDPENDRNRRNERRRNAGRGVPLAHAVAPRAERAVQRAAEEVDLRAERAVRRAAEEVDQKAAEKAALRPESRPTASALTKSRLTTSRATPDICARSENDLVEMIRRQSTGMFSQIWGVW